MSSSVLRIIWAAVAIFVAIDRPANAAQIVQTRPVTQEGSDGGPFDIYGADFDVTLGTLQSITAEIYGTYRTDIYTPNASTFPNPTPSTLEYGFNFFGAGNFFSGTLGSLPLHVVGTDLVSMPVNIDLTFSIPDFTIFEQDVVNPDLLGEFEFGSLVGGGLGASSDDSRFIGTMILTYTYSVSEPGSFCIFLGSLFAVAGAYFANGRVRHVEIRT